MRLIVARNLDKNEWNIDKLLCKFKLELELPERDAIQSQNVVHPSQLKIKEDATEGDCPIP